MSSRDHHVTPRRKRYVATSLRCPSPRARSRRDSLSLRSSKRPPTGAKAAEEDEEEEERRGLRSSSDASSSRNASCRDCMATPASRTTLAASQCRFFAIPPHSKVIARLFSRAARTEICFFCAALSYNVIMETSFLLFYFSSASAP